MKHESKNSTNNLQQQNFNDFSDFESLDEVYLADEPLDEVFLDEDLFSLDDSSYQANGDNTEPNIEYIPEEDNFVYGEVFERPVNAEPPIHAAHAYAGSHPQQPQQDAPHPGHHPHHPQQQGVPHPGQPPQPPQSAAARTNGMPANMHASAPLNGTLISAASIVPTPAPVGKARPHKKGPSFSALLVFILLFLAVGVLIFVMLFPWKVQVSLNGKDVETRAHTAVSQVIEANNLKVQAGNLLAIDGNVLREGEGTKYTVKVNGEQVSDDHEINGGDSIEVGPGENIVEEYTEEELPITPDVQKEGTGALHYFLNNGEKGLMSRKTGKESGIVQDTVITEPTINTLQYMNVDTNGDKVVALTFDDGPWETYTEEILNVLAENGAKATFFTVGDRIEGHEATLQREYAEGHEVASHSFDHARGSGQSVNLGYMTEDEQRQEITKGYEVIEQTIGAPASSSFRVPGGNLNEETARILSDYSIAEIGWNIDTHDWKKPGVPVIVENILSVEPGGIILMHDGGGDRSQTVAALQQALPELVSQGYEFVTISELIQRYVAPKVDSENGNADSENSE